MASYAENQSLLADRFRAWQILHQGVVRTLTVFAGLGSFLGANRTPPGELDPSVGTPEDDLSL
jgi:hypothetical protein